jgi:hypothetical protein
VQVVLSLLPLHARPQSVKKLPSGPGFSVSVILSGVVICLLHVGGHIHPELSSTVPVPLPVTVTAMLT